MSGNMIAICHLANALKCPYPQAAPDWTHYASVHMNDFCDAATTSARWYCDKKIGDSEETRVQIFNIDDPAHTSKPAT